jgi:hypothetical protein
MVIAIAEVQNVPSSDDQLESATSENMAETNRPTLLEISTLETHSSNGQELSVSKFFYSSPLCISGLHQCYRLVRKNSCLIHI